MDEFSLDAVARRSVKGVFALVSRTFLIQILSIVASFILTVYLSPENYGVFFVVSSIIIFLTYFQDIGLAAALIQKKEEVTLDELRTTFTIQQILVLLVVVPSFLFSGQIASFYKLGSEGHILLVSLIGSFFLSSLRTIPTVMMERRLEFNKLVVPQILENLAYNLCLIFFAVSGYGVTTFTIAVASRSIVGLVATYIIQPWKIGFSLHFASVKNLIKFGLPFQANNILALIKDDLLTIYIGKTLMLSQVGYIGFAQKWAYLPLRLVMDNVIKITFPSMSRLQHDKQALRTAIEKSLFLVSFLIFPIAAFIIGYSSLLVEFIPKYQKWQPALLALSFYAMSTVFSSISTPLTNFLTAIGKIKITLYFMIFWTVLTWGLTPLFIMKFGYNGVAAASFLVSITSVIVFVVARRYIEFSFTKPVLRQLLAAGIMFGFILFTKSFITNFPVLFLDAIVAGVLYLGVIYFLAREELVKTLKFIIISVRSKN